MLAGSSPVPPVWIKLTQNRGHAPPPAPRGQLVDSRAGWAGEGIAKEKTPQWEPKT